MESGWAEMGVRLGWAEDGSGDLARQSPRQTAPPQGPRCVSTRRPDLRPKLQDKQTSLPTTKSGRPAAAPHGALEQVSPSARPGKAVSQVATALWVLGIRAPWFSKLDVLGARLSGAGLGSWGAWRGGQILCSSEALWVLSSLLTGGGGVGVAFMLRLCPTCWLWAFSLAPCVEVAQFLGFFRGRCSICICRFSVCVAILNLSFKRKYLIIYFLTKSIVNQYFCLPPEQD